MQLIVSPTISRLIKEEILDGIERESILHDFGDYAPFLYAYGEHALVEQHVKLIESATDSFSKPYRLQSGVLTFDYNYEIILGLIEIYRLSKQERFLQFAEKHMLTCLSNFLFFKVIVSRYRGIPNFLVSYYAYVMVELLLDLYELTGKPLYLEKSHLLVSEFLRRERWRPTLFANYDYLFCSNLGKKVFTPNGFFIGKNTSIIFGLTKLAAVTGDDELKNLVKKYLLEINSLMVREQVVYRYCRLDSGAIHDPCISASFMYINMLNNFTSLFRDQATLNIAQAITVPYLDNVGATGLFPYRIGSDRRCFVDGNTDFSIALLELFQLTGNERYKQYATNCFQGMLRYNLKYSSVDVETGEATDPVVFKSYRTRAKFKALFLKLSLCIENDLNVIGTGSYASLLRDR